MLSRRPRVIILYVVSFLTATTLLFLHPSTRTRLTDLSAYVPSFQIIYPQPTLHTALSGIRKVADPAQLPSHPILELIKEGKKQAEALERKKASIMTLADAIADYRQAFEMSPPEGFERWYELAKSLNATTAPSLIPLAHTSVLPFLALPPALLRQRANDSLSIRSMCALHMTPRKGKDGAELSALDDVSSDWLRMVQEDIDLLPPLQNASEPIILPVWADDSAWRMVDAGLLKVSRAMAKKGLVWDEEVLIGREKESEHRLGWSSTCEALETDFRLEEGSMDDSPKRFVSDLSASGDYCAHPELLEQNGELIMRAGLPMRPLSPAMVIGRPQHGADIVGPPTQMTAHIIKEPLPWENKTDSRLLWRGQISGIYHIDPYPWRLGQRDRLSFFVNPGDHNKSAEILVDRQSEIVREVWRVAELSKKYLDVGIIFENLEWHCGLNGAQQFACHVDEHAKLRDCPGRGKACEDMKAEHTWVDRVAPEDAGKYKFILDVDGYGWSSRWRKELSSGSVLLKSTIYTEWWTPQAVPWYHFIPTLYDYTDLFDIMAFFTGPPDGQEVTSHDDLAAEIGTHGKDFAVHNLRWEDMRSYMFLLMLEYRRAWSDDRSAATLAV